MVVVPTDLLFLINLPDFKLCILTGFTVKFGCKKHTRSLWFLQQLVLDNDFWVFALVWLRVSRLLRIQFVVFDKVSTGFNRAIFRLRWTLNAFVVIECWRIYVFLRYQRRLVQIIVVHFFFWWSQILWSFGEVTWWTITLISHRLFLDDIAVDTLPWTRFFSGTELLFISWNFLLTANLLEAIELPSVSVVSTDHHTPLLIMLLLLKVLVNWTSVVDIAGHLDSVLAKLKVVHLDRFVLL